MILIKKKEKKKKRYDVLIHDTKPLRAYENTKQTKEQRFIAVLRPKVTLSLLTRSKNITSLLVLDGP